MKAVKVKYYALDDMHEIISQKPENKAPGSLDKQTKEFFQKRRKGVKKVPSKVKS